MMERRFERVVRLDMDEFAQYSEHEVREALQAEVDGLMASMRFEVEAWIDTEVLSAL